MSSGGRHHAPRRRNGLARRTRLRRAAPRDFSAPFYASLEFRRATDLQLSESVRRAHRKIDAAMPGAGERPVLAARTDRFPAEVRIEPGCARGEKGAIAARQPNAPRFLCAGPARPGPARFGSAEFSLVRPMPADRGSSGIRRHELEHVRPLAAERHRSPFSDSTGARRRVPGTRRASRQASIDKKTGPPKRTRRHARCAVISSRRLRTTRRSSCARHLSCA